MTDGDGNVTTIQHGSGGAPLSILSPYGQTTGLGVDGTITSLQLVPESSLALLLIAGVALLAAACGGVVPPFLSVADMAAVLGSARQIVGLDTGFSHLAAAFGQPTIGIYCDHEPGLAGITGPGPVASLGGKGKVPSLDEVMRALDGQLALA